MIVVVASILPIALYLLVLKLLDSFALIHPGIFLECLVWGAVCGLGLYFIGKSGVLELYGISLMPLLEELLKGGLLIYMISGRRIRFLAETIIYGAATGGGFALTENIFYLAFNPDMTVDTAIFRGFDCAFLHIGCTALVAALFLLLSNRNPFVSVLLSFVPPVILHFLHNGIDIPPTIKLAFTALLFFFIFVGMFNLGEKKIYNWIDHSISTDIQTLSSIKKGNFSSTKTGMYLLSMKEQFKPEVFFDVINYVELYLELKIEKQSRMLLSQTGFKPDDVSEEIYQSKRKELLSLKSLIGKTGFIVLRPIVQEEVF